MKIKDGYILKKLAGEAIVVSALPSEGSNSIIELNESGVILWNVLKNGADINDLVECAHRRIRCCTGASVKRYTEFY